MSGDADTVREVLDDVCGACVASDLRVPSAIAALARLEAAAEGFAKAAAREETTLSDGNVAWLFLVCFLSSVLWFLAGLGVGAWLL